MSTLQNTSQPTCGDPRYYNRRLAEDVYPSIYNHWVSRQNEIPCKYLVNRFEVKHKLRRILVDYLAEFCEKHKVSTDSRALAIFLFDQFDFATFMANGGTLDCPLPREVSEATRAILLIQACLLVAAKVEDIHYHVPTAQDFQSVTMQDTAVCNYLLSCSFPIQPSSVHFRYLVDRLKLPRFMPKAYQDTEICILKYFDWTINFPTMSNFLSAYISELKLSITDATDHRLTKCVKELIIFANYLAELAIQRPEILYSDLPSYVAAACLQVAFHINETSNWDTFSKSELQLTVQDLDFYMQRAVYRVHQEIDFDNERFLKLSRLLLDAHADNQGESAPPTPPPDYPDTTQQSSLYRQNYVPAQPNTVQYENMGRNCRTINGRFQRFPNPVQQRAQPYPMSGTYWHQKEQFNPQVPAYMAHLTPPETPTSQIVGTRCLTAGSKQRLIYVLPPQK